MKKVLGIVVSLILSLIAIVAVVFLTLNTFKNPKTLPKIASMTNYYDEAYPKILDGVKHQVGNIKLQEIVEAVVTKDRVKTDIDKVINEGDKVKDTIGNDIKNDLLVAFKENLSEKYEEEALTELVDLVGNTYEKSLFPNQEYEMVYKVINKIPMISIIFIGTLAVFLVISLLLLIFAKRGYKIVAVSNYITGLVLLFPYLFVNLGGLFTNFYYTNAYWTIFIKRTINYLFNAFGIAGIVFIVLGIIVSVLEHIVKKEK